MTDLLERREIIKEHFEPNAPSPSQLQQELDRQLQALESRPAEERLGRPKVPDIVVRQEDSWDDLGWSRRDRDEISEQLRTVLSLTENERKNALEILLGAGITPEEAKERITQEKFNASKTYFKTPSAKEQSEAEAQGREPREVSDEEAELQAKYSMLKGLKIRDDYIKHFILTDDFKAEVQNEFDNVLPANLTELARDIAYYKDADFGVNGKFPVIQMQIKKDANGKVIDGRYCINEANFMRWIRSEINVWYDIEPESVTDYFSRIKVQKGQFTSVDLATMLYDPRYFKDEAGEEYEDLKAQVLLEPWMLMTIREYDVEYKNAMGDEGKLAEMYNKNFFFSKLAKKTYDKTMMYYMATLSTDFQGKDSDTSMGEAWNKLFLAYYNISDFEGLQDILGADSSFFTQKGMLKAVKKVHEKKSKQTGMPMLGEFLGDKAPDFAKAFDANGNVTTKENKQNFVKFINFFTAINPSHDVIDVVKYALRDAVQGLVISKQANTGAFDDSDVQNGRVIDDHTMQVAELIAFSWLRFSGAGAKNDVPGVAAFDAQTKWLNTEAYRRKMATQARGGAFGNPFTVSMFRAVGVDMMRALRVENGYTYDEHGNKRRLTPLEVMERMREVSAGYEQARKELQGQIETATGADKQRLLQELNDLDELEKIDFKQVAGQLEFSQNSLQNYAANHVARAKVIYEQIMGAHEITFDKFVTYDSLVRGVSFNRAEFQKQVQEGFLKPLRYLYETYGDLNFEMKVRAPVFKGRKDDKDIWEYKTMPLGEMIFGYEILNIPEFRKKNKAGKAKKKNGRYEIDYAKVQKNQTLAWKQWALMKIGADLWSHIDRHGTDPAYDMAHYFDVLEAIETIPGEVWGDDKKMKNMRVVTPFFSHSQMKWLKKMSGTTTMELFTRGIFSDIFADKHRKGGLFDDSFSLITAAIFRGY